jgi:hypothetical protein
MKFYEAASKNRLFVSFFCSQKWFGMDFKVPRMVQNGIAKFFLLKNG